jgi:hypothetical protein
MRVTVDLDDKSIKRLKKVYRRLCFLTGKAPKVRASSFGKGYHLIVWGLDITYQESLWIRYKCGDDMRRIYFDTETNNKPRQILWNAKRFLLGDPDKFKSGIVRDLEWTRMSLN